MNKQAFTFLTLFTLVLMLSIYYVTLPADSKQIELDELIVNSESDPIDQYKMLKQEQDLETISQNEQVISSSTSSSEEKLEALNQNSLLEAATQYEKNLQQILSENGFESCFVEKNDEIVRVVLSEEYNDRMNALKVIQLVYQISDEDVFVEVSFE